MTLDRDEVADWLARRIADYKCPERLVVLDELPTTSMIKIDERAVAERARQEP